MKYHVLILLALGASAWPAPLLAQDRWPVSVEAYVGATQGGSDNSAGYRGATNGILADILVGLRLHSPDRAGAFVALDAAGHGLNAVRTDDCLIAPDGGCVPWFPGFGTVSLLGGWESRSTRLRLLAGPGIVSSDYDEAPGFVGRVDAALPAFGRLSVTATANTLVVPSWNGDRFFFVAVGLGLRVR